MDLPSFCTRARDSTRNLASKSHEEERRKHVIPISLSASSKREVLVRDSSRSLRAGSRAEDGGSTPASRQIWQGAQEVLSKVQLATAGPGAGAGPSPRLRPEGAERKQDPGHYKTQVSQCGQTLDRLTRVPRRQIFDCVTGNPKISLRQNFDCATGKIFLAATFDCATGWLAGRPARDCATGLAAPADCPWMPDWLAGCMGAWLIR